jgi:hypothetical protein
MSLINDALKQVQPTPPRNGSNPRPIFRTEVKKSSPVALWVVSTLAILLIATGIFFLGWSISESATDRIVTKPAVNTNNTAAIAEVPPPAVEVSPAVTNPPPASEPETTDVPVPRLQGIFYSPTAPTAIMGGKTVRPGDQIGPYYVKTISKYTVTLVGPDHKDILVGMQ